ncbi:MAG: hypothetical protein HYV61_00315 [Candidatus Rokubacteria bacterium]|nr:hypothetical protein [Candidatus Rokubacteria bacterium]
MISGPRRLAGLLLWLLLIPAALPAAEWGGVTPGQSTQDDVRGLFGPPTRERSGREEGYETREWLYEGEAAPAGLIKLEVQFGLLGPEGFKPETVRALILYPGANRFPLASLQVGWGRPSQQGTDSKTGRPTLIWDEGLVVFLDKEGRWAEEMYFVIPQLPAAQ